jgi:hypothetical protein
MATDETRERRVGLDLPEVIGVDPNYALLALLAAKVASPFQVFVAKRCHHKASRDWIGIPYPRP